MLPAANTTAVLQDCLDRLQRGDEASREQLLLHSQERLRILARHMLGQFARLRRWEQTDDILQAALLKLHISLATVNPPTVREFYALAVVQIRRVLIDLARHYFGPEGPALWHQSPPAGALSSGWLTEHAGPTSREPLTLADWTDFHTHVAALDGDLRETFELLFYHGLRQNQAATLLGVSEKTVHRRWYKARVSLADSAQSGQ